MRNLVTCVALLSLLCGCGVSVRGTGGVSLRQYPKLYFVLSTATGAVSVNSAAGSSISVSHAMSGSSQAMLVAQDLSFELAALGFQMVDSQDKADAVALFSIGSVRYDPLVGWIADQAFLVFKDAESGATISAFRADTQFITPTVKGITDSLVRAVRKHY